MASVTSVLKQRVLIERRRLAEWRARASLRSNRSLWASLDEYKRLTNSTGCSYSDYWHLYRYIRQNAPAEILECGTGVSTLIIATALAENERERGVRGRVTSMEEHPEWLEMSRRLLPGHLSGYVDFRLSQTVEDCFSVFRGVRYREVPEHRYDFVFVDGPKYKSPSDGALTFDFDLVHVLRRADWPVAALVDKRVSTCYVLQQLLGAERVSYSPVVHLGFLRPSSRRDLCHVDTTTPSRSFEPSFRVVGRTRLTLSRVPGSPRDAR